MRPVTLSLLAATYMGVVVLAVPALAAPVLVGTTTLASGADPDDADPDDTDAVGNGQQIRAQATVVNNLEPASGEDADPACPAGGCDYQLLLSDPEVVDGDAGAGATCGGRDYGVVDASPRERALPGGARVYVGQGSVPRETVAAGVDGLDPLTPGVGQLCFVTTAHADGPGDPVAATQPAPVVVVYDPAAEPSR